MTAITVQQAKERLAGFDEYVNQTLETWNAPGSAVAIIAGGEIVHSAGYGLRDVAKGLPVTPDTLFAIGSCTKAFTAFDIGLLVDEGKIAWNTPVQHKLPDFRLQDQIASANATPKDLLMHRTGLPRHDLAWYGSPHSREELFERLQYFQPSLGFREGFQYNNLMFMTAGYLAGKVAGAESWEAFTRERILDPLGMKRSNFSVHVSEKEDNAAQPYMWINEKPTLVPFRNLDHLGPAGSINSSVVEFAPWLLMHMNGGVHDGKPMVKPETLKEMHRPHIVMPLPPESPWFGATEVGQTSYGLGWAGQTYRGRTMVRHTGGIDGFITFASFLPEEGVGTIILTNTGLDLAAASIHCHVYDRLLGLDLLDWNGHLKTHYAKLKDLEAKGKADLMSKQKQGTTPSHPIAEYAGDFENAGYGDLTIRTEGGGLMINFNGLEMKGIHHHYDVFRFENDEHETVMPSTFVTNFDGEIASVQIPMEPATPPITFTRKAKA